MASALFRSILAASLVLAVTPVPSQAQFGFRKIPRIMPGPVFRGGPHFFNRGLHIRRFHSILGLGAAVIVGGVILSRLSKGEREEVGRRSKAVVYKDPETRVSDTYETKDKQVTITADPAQKVADLKDDPALKQTAEDLKPTGKKDKALEGTVKVGDLPPDTQCRKVTTQLAVKPAKGAVGAQTAEAKPDDSTTQVSIHCKTSDGEWKPAST